MGTFSQLNQLYVASFGLRPPVRVCVQNIGNDVGQVCMGALYATDSQLAGRVNMHVQSFSTWAPANIGPYSQGNLMSPEKHKWLLLAGQIGMTPGLMALFGTVPEQFD